MKKVFVVSDIHSFHSIFYSELIKNGFDINNKDHILIVCGDPFDRGDESRELLDFLLSIPKGQLILVRGNHDDLMLDLLKHLKNKTNFDMAHWSNGTLKTVEHLTGINKYDLLYGIYDYNIHIKKKLNNYFKLMKQSVDYYELGNYIFVHGWVPFVYEDRFPEEGIGAYCVPVINLKASKDMWESARWKNGMECARQGITIPGKTIVCGHWHTGYGHCHILKTCTDEDECFDIYYNDGIIALDACTVLSNKVNVLVLEIDDDK